jgi:hypothetical protein
LMERLKQSSETGLPADRHHVGPYVHFVIIHNINNLFTSICSLFTFYSFLACFQRPWIMSPSLVP